MANWQEATEWEKNWWEDCCNTYGEECKQLEYIRKMGLNFVNEQYTRYRIDGEGKNIIDIGGGPVSILLKCFNIKGTILDPCNYPEWVYSRYRIARIDIRVMKGELMGSTFKEKEFDEAWIYNVLQHVDDPELIIKNAQKVSKLIRIFEFADIGISPGHIHNLTEENLNKWLCGEGKTEKINWHPTGYSYYGIFPT